MSHKSTWTLFGVFANLLAISCFYAVPCETIAQTSNRHLIVVAGAAGETEFGDQFQVWAQRWLDLASNVKETDGIAEKNTDGWQVHSFGMGEQNVEASDRDRIESTLAEIAALETQPELWIVLIGHGTYDGKTAKFNLKGPDFSATELKAWLKPIQSRVALINCSSCSSPFINQLSGPNRIVITATRSGSQYNFARFGNFLSQAIGDETIDLDKDGQNSLLEAYIAAVSQTEEFYAAELRIPTEQALLDDNGDQRGTPANWFNGVRVTKRVATDTKNEVTRIADGIVANQCFFMPRDKEVQLSEADLKSRNELEIELERLRVRKTKMVEDDYYDRLEELMLKIGKIYLSQEK